MGKEWKQSQTLFLWAPKSVKMMTSALKLKALAPWKKSYYQSRQLIQIRDITLPTKVHLVNAMVFPVVMYICESWTIKKAAAAAKSLQSCPTLCDPIDGSPSGFTIPGILQARTLEWVAISFSNA